jgi:AraC-like DNA-binding protein
MRRRKRDTSELVARVKQHLSRTIGIRVRLAQIARTLGVSPGHLGQQFRAHEGMPPYQYALQLRLRRASELLEMHDDLGRLAVELGFASHSHFSTAFRRWAGCTPGVYRARMRALRASAQSSSYPCRSGPVALV